MEPVSENERGRTNLLELPAPTAWPMILAFGISLVIAGMVTNLAVSVLGALLAVISSIGWFRQVLPHECHERVEVQVQVLPVVSTRSSVARLPVDAMHRKMLPLETYSITAGIKGGIAGGIAMTIPAVLYGVFKFHSVWYAINLFAAGGFVSWAGASNAFLSEFHLRGFLAALGIHAVASVLVGLLYGAMLPMYPKYPILTAGFIAPFLWTGLLYTTLGIVSPILDQRIDWLWFAISQCLFGLVAGYVVNRQVKVRTPQFRALPFAIRAGLQGEGRDRTEKKDSVQ